MTDLSLSYLKQFFLCLVTGIMLTFIPACAPDEEDLPEADPRDKFTGNWKVKDVVPSGATQYYTSEVSYDPNNNSKIIISNIYRTNTSIKALVAGNMVYLDETKASNFIITGSGIYGAGGFTLDCKAIDGDEKTFKANYYR